MLKRCVFFVALLLAIIQPLFSQDEPSPEIVQLPLQHFSRTTTVQPLTITEDWRPHMRNTQRIHSPGKNLHKDRLFSLKQQANAAADLARSGTPNSTGVIPKSSGITPPAIMGGFMGNGYSGSVPNDNDIAVSRDGMIVSVTNELIHVYDTVGNQHLNLSLAAFGGAAISSAKVFDPRVIYDANHDRFVVVYLNGATSATSHLIVAFSQGPDPTGGWNVYAIPADLYPSNIHVWADFPQIGISEEELFITCNLFGDNGDAPGSGTWQIQLAEGYIGTPLVTQTYVLFGVFHLTPVKCAMNAYGPNFYFIRKASFTSSNDFEVYEIDNTIANSGQYKPPVTLVSNMRYAMPPNVAQKGTSQRLESDEGRMQSAYKKGNRIYFAMATGHNSLASIYVGTISLSPLGVGFSTIRGEIIQDDTLELGFPSITFGGITGSSGDCDQVLMFNFASPHHYPGNGVVYIDTAGNASDPVICAEGLNSHGFGNPNQAYRWGDYSGIAIRKPGEVWVAGYHVRADSRNMTWISQVATSSPGVTSPIENGVFNPESNITAYPSPAIDMVFFEFEVSQAGIYRAEILNVAGQSVYLVMEEKLKPGPAKTGFNTMPLANGVYTVQVKGEKGALLQKRFVVGH